MCREIKLKRKVQNADFSISNLLIRKNRGEKLRDRIKRSLFSKSGTLMVKKQQLINSTGSLKKREAVLKVPEDVILRVKKNLLH